MGRPPRPKAKPIFNSANYQVTERQRQSTPRRRRGTTFSIGRSQEAAASRTVGGSATSAARKARLAAGRGAERTMKRLPPYAISVSVRESRSAMISGQGPERPSAAILSSSALCRPAACRRRVSPGGSTARHIPIRHQSGRSDISSDRGRTSPGSCPSTMEAPPRIKMGPIESK